MLHSRWHSFIWPLIFFVAIFAWGGAAIHSPQTTASAEEIPFPTATQPILSFWHRFELPAGSLGTVDISLDEGLTWTSIYTQTTSITAWTEVTVDLTPYVGHEVALAFFLRNVGTGEILQQSAPSTALEEPLATEAASFASPFLPLWLFPLLMGMGGVALIRYRPQWVKTTTVSGFLLLLVATSITSCIAIGPGSNFDPEALDVQGGNLEIVIPAEHYIMNAQVSPGGTWLAYTYQYQGDNGRSNIATNLLNIPENKLYDKPLAGWSGAPWLDDNPAIPVANEFSA